MSERVQRIEARLRETLAPLRLEIVDDSARHAGHAGARAGGGHYIVTVVSARFAGLSPVKRHQLVYASLGDVMRAEIHALSLRTLTPDEH